MAWAEQLCAQVLVNGVLDETNQRDRSVSKSLGSCHLTHSRFEHHDRNRQATWHWFNSFNSYSSHFEPYNDQRRKTCMKVYHSVWLMISPKFYSGWAVLLLISPNLCCKVTLIRVNIDQADLAIRCIHSLNFFDPWNIWNIWISMVW